MFSSTSTSTPTTIHGSTTTTTTLVELFTRTLGFYKNHPDITQAILSGAGGLTVCGHEITDVMIDDAHSAIEALCTEIHGDQQTELLRQLLTAALTMAAGGSSFGDYAACDAVCRDPNASTMALAGCVDDTDAFNQSGDNVTAPFDPPGAAQAGPCQAAFETPCEVLTPGSCAVQ
jgi:hypothetical protein